MAISLCILAPKNHYRIENGDRKREEKKEEGKRK